jgi:hypothetical protein
MKYLNLNTWILIGLGIAAVGSSVLSALENPSLADAGWRSGWLQNFSTELFGAIVTYWLFDLVN